MNTHTARKKSEKNPNNNTDLARTLSDTFSYLLLITII